MIVSKEFYWWQTGVIYQIYPRSFMDSDGDGIGDLTGIIQRLDYLSNTLAVDAIWLSPFYPSPMADFGYDVSDYTNIDPVFGNLDIFDQLVSISHQRGLKVIIDFVPNHCSDQHPWFLESRASRENPKRDWFIWKDAKPDGSTPNNWLSVFGGPAWEWDQNTGQYYLHSFLKEQPDLNWRNPQVKAAMFDVLRFWLERGVDGFRIDVAHFVLKDLEFRDNPLKTDTTRAMHKSLGEYDSQIHLYDHSHPDIHSVYRDIRELLDGYSDDQPRVSIGEIHIFDWEKWASYYGTELDELHMPFNFQLLGVDWQAPTIKQIVDSLEAVLSPGAWPNYVLGNHDEIRLTTRIGMEGARLAAMLLLTLRGTPTLYYGDEIGMTSVDIPPNKEQDPWGNQVPGLGRDGCRTPMQWGEDLHSGFSPPDTKSTWLPVSENYQNINIEAQLDQLDSLLNLYRKLLGFRKMTPALQVGNYLPIEGIIDECFAYRREHSGHPPLSVVLNFSNQDVPLKLTEKGSGEIIISTYLDREEEIDLKEVHLRKFEGIIVKHVH
jgi:glycosidase